MKLTHTLLSVAATTSLALGVAATSPRPAPPSSLSNSQARLVVEDDNDKLNVPGKNPLGYCADPEDYLLEIDNVDLDPNPPEAGKNLTITATGTVKDKVDKGTKAHIEVKYGIIKILTQDIDLCEQASNVDLECPLEKGKEIELTKKVELPKEIPPGKYTVLANVTTEKDDIVTCLRASVVFKPHIGSSLFGSEEL